MWTLDNGDYACADVSPAELTDDDPHDISAYIATDLGSLGDCGDVDHNFGGTEQNSGGAHSWVNVAFNADGD